MTDLSICSPYDLFKERPSLAVLNGELVPRFTLDEYDIESDGIKYISAYKIYMESVDEYEAAIKIAGSIGNWQKLTSSDWFMNGWRGFTKYRGLSAWRDDMRMRDESQAKAMLLKQMRQGNVAAARKILDTASNSPMKVNKKKQEAKIKEDNLFTLYSKSVENDLERLSNFSGKDNNGY